MPPFALVRRPAASLASGCVSFIERQPVDVERARRQWLAYVAALNSGGWPTVEVAPDDTLPDSVFIEDAVVMFGDLAVITNPARADSPSRDPGGGRDDRTARICAGPHHERHPRRR